MAIVQRDVMIDDTDGQDAADTVVITLQGIVYELDLSPENIETFKSEWIQFARERDATIKDGWWRTPPGATAPVKKRYQELRRTIRDWLQERGHPVADRGYVPPAMNDEWLEADPAHREMVLELIAS